MEYLWIFSDQKSIFKKKIQYIIKSKQVWVCVRVNLIKICNFRVNFLEFLFTIKI